MNASNHTVPRPSLTFTKEDLKQMLEMMASVKPVDRIRRTAMPCGFCQAPGMMFNETQNMVYCESCNRGFVFNFPMSPTKLFTS